MKIILLIVVVSVVLGMAFLGLAIQVIFKKDHKFPNIHVGGNKNLSERGITCAQSWDRIEQRKARKEIDFKKMKVYGGKP
jgi:hypothetical protein